MSHAGFNADFVVNCYRAGLVDPNSGKGLFSKGEMRRFAGTFQGMRTPDGGFAGCVDGGKGPEGERSILISIWGRLAIVDPAVRAAMGEFLLRQEDRTHFCMLLAGHVVEAQRPFHMESALMPSSQPATSPADSPEAP